MSGRRKISLPLWAYDQALCQNSAPALIGVDEAGRGALAGPVVAAAVFVDAAFFASKEAQAEATAINDSKQLKPEQREAQHSIILQWKARGLVRCAWAAGSVAEIETLNILGATRLAMQRSLEALGLPLPGHADDLPLFQTRDAHPADARYQDASKSVRSPASPLTSQTSYPTARILVDGKPLKPFPYAHQGLVKGDGTSLCIAAASILAKVERDRLMGELCTRHAGYGFSQHKGYGTDAHCEALRRLGPCPEHRQLFLRKVLVAD